MPTTVEIKQRLNNIAQAATKTFNSFRTKVDKQGKPIENNYDFSKAARAMVQEAYDLGVGAKKANQTEPVEVDHQDDSAQPDAPVAEPVATESQDAD